MRILKCLLFSFLMSASFAFAQAPVLSRVSVQGNKFVTDGKTIIFRGLDTSDPDRLASEGHWTKEYFEDMKGGTNDRVVTGKQLCKRKNSLEP